MKIFCERFKDKSFIIPSTIHSFSWSVISQYWKFLIESINELYNAYLVDGDLQYGNSNIKEYLSITVECEFKKFLTLLSSSGKIYTYTEYVSKLNACK